MEPRRKTIYVRESDEGLWRNAVGYARSHRISISALIMTALEAYLEGSPAGPAGDPD